MLTATAPADTRLSADEFASAERLTSGRRADATPIERAWRQVDASSVVAFRVALGLLGAFSAARFLSKGWVESLYLAPEHHLTYPWFPWVRPLPAAPMYAVVAAMIPLGLAVAAGWRTRLAAAGFVVAFTYCELIDAALYLNHYWFVTLTFALLAVLPTSGRSTVPALVVWVLRFQVGIVYVMAGLAKLNHDWLLRGEPMTTWLAARTGTPIVGGLFDERWVGLAASWLGTAFDLTIVVWLSWRRSRRLGYAALVVFHVLTWRLFAIGVFPWVMIAATTIFFPPEWSSRVLGRAAPQRRAGVFMTERSGRHPSVLVLAAVVWAALQVAIPLRHLAYPGDVRWTEEGYYGSFRVMLTEKAGLLRFTVTDPKTAETWTVEPTLVLTDWQARQAAIRPELALAAARLVADDFAAGGHDDVVVRADSWVSFNGGQRQRMIDPQINLAILSRRAPAATYVLPLDPAVRG
jgi:vitamin K-dependent gamma-carboxylase